MTATLTGPEVTGADVTTLPLAPKNPLPYGRRLVAIRQFDTGPELLRESGGPVTRIVLGPKWMMPPLVFVSSPQGAHDILARTDAFAERAIALPSQASRHADLIKLVAGDPKTLQDAEHDEQRGPAMPEADQEKRDEERRHREIGFGAT